MPKYLGKVGDLLQVAKYGVRCEVAHRHVVDHPLAQWGDLAGGRNGESKRCVVAHGEHTITKNFPEKTSEPSPLPFRSV